MVSGKSANTKRQDNLIQTIDNNLKGNGIGMKIDFNNTMGDMKSHL